MIITLLLKIAYVVLSAMIGLLPDSSGFSSDVLSAGTQFGSYFGMFSPVIPLSTVATAVGVVFGVEIAIFFWKTLKSIISHIPQFGGSGH